MPRPKNDPVEETLRRYLFLSDDQQQAFDRSLRLIRAGLSALADTPPPKRTRKPKAPQPEAVPFA